MRGKAIYFTKYPIQIINFISFFLHIKSIRYEESKINKPNI